MASPKRLSHPGPWHSHVQPIVVLVFCNLLLATAHPSAALIKLLAARHSHGSRSTPVSLDSSSHSNSDSQPLSAFGDDVKGVWPVDSDDDGDDHVEGEPDEWDDDSSEVLEEVKRFHPSAFYGSRGKRTLLKGLSKALSDKRFMQGFVGSRGKRRGEYPYSLGEEAEEEELAMKRFDPSGFSGSRGKRFIPGLEALFLSQMYKKLDAEKWKRQSLRGFHAARG